jgi:hypothetical protein
VPAALHRLAARFPALQIVLIAPTHGYFMYGPPVSPAEEARLIGQWAEAHGMDYPLAVTETPFLKLGAPDGRYFERPDSNLAPYTFGTGGAPTPLPFNTYLVDQKGLVVYAPLAPMPTQLGDQEAIYAKLIDVLLHREENAS